LPRPAAGLLLGARGAVAVRTGRLLLAPGAVAAGACPRPGARRGRAGHAVAEPVPRGDGLVVRAGLAGLHRGDGDLLADGGQARRALSRASLSATRVAGRRPRPRRRPPGARPAAASAPRRR